MARNDDRRVIQIKGDKNKVPQLSDVQDAIRQLSEMVYKLEGRVGQIELREGLRITADEATPLTLESRVVNPVDADFKVFLWKSTLTTTSATFLVRGANLTTGPRGDQWTATSTSAVIISLTKNSGVKFYFDDDLTIGQPFVPTEVGSFP
jgi:hypothetical protein